MSEQPETTAYTPPDVGEDVWYQTDGRNFEYYLPAKVIITEENLVKEAAEQGLISWITGPGRVHLFVYGGALLRVRRAVGPRRLPALVALSPRERLIMGFSWGSQLYATDHVQHPLIWRVLRNEACPPSRGGWVPYRAHEENPDGPPRRRHGDLRRVPSHLARILDR